MEASNISHDSSAAGSVNEPILVTLYAPDGEPIQVRSDKVESWLTKGFSQTENDPEKLLAEFKVAVEAVLKPVQAYVQAVTSDGYIDTADLAAQAVAYTAVEQVGSAWVALANTITTLYPVRQGEAVRMKAGENYVDVDPNQVALHREQGYKKVIS